MAGLNLVDWSSLLAPGCGIPHDVSFNIVPTDPENEDEVDEGEGALFHAHKNLLAAVSTVFRTQFYGSLPQMDRVIYVKDSTRKAFGLMLEYIYQKSDANSKIENLTEIGDIFDVFYLAHKFDVLGFKAKILSRLRSMTVNMSNYEDLTRALDQFKHFEDACQLVERRLCTFIAEHPNPLDLVPVAMNYSSVVVKEEVLYILSEVAESDPLKVLQVANQIIDSDESKSIDIKSVLKPVMKSCIKGYEAALIVPLLYSQFLPSSSAGFDQELTMIQRAWKENFCKNCESAVCKHGDPVDASTVKIGTKVQVATYGQQPVVGRRMYMQEQGVVSEIGLSIYNRIRTRGDHGREFMGEGCTAGAHSGRWGAGIPTEAISCPGIHKASSPVFRIKLVNGGEKASSEFTKVSIYCK